MYICTYEQRSVTTSFMSFCVGCCDDPLPKVERTGFEVNNGWKRKKKERKGAEREQFVGKYLSPSSCSTLIDGYICIFLLISPLKERKKIKLLSAFSSFLPPFCFPFDRELNKCQEANAEVHIHSLALIVALHCVASFIGEQGRDLSIYKRVRNTI